MIDSAWLEINLTALRNNYSTMKNHCPTAQASAVVKSNAYGLGVDVVVPALFSEGCRQFFVATLDEAITLNNIVKSLPQNIEDDALRPVRIYVLNGLFAQDAGTYLEYGILPCLNSLEQIQLWQSACHRHGAPAPAAVYVDTGFNRLGLDEANIESLRNETAPFEGWHLELIMSHLACGDTPDHPMNRAQLERFHNALTALPEAPASLANSAGVWLGSDYHFDLTRCGISLYGGAASQLPDTILEPVASVFAHILQLRVIAIGESVGYGADFVAQNDMRIAILSIGYGDGIIRQAGRSQPGFAHVFVAGHAVPIIGRISMDLLAIDVSEIEAKLETGMAVEIFGPNASIDSLAEISQTISYELLTRLGTRYKRILK